MSYNLCFINFFVWPTLIGGAILKKTKNRISGSRWTGTGLKKITYIKPYKSFNCCFINFFLRPLLLGAHNRPFFPIYRRRIPKLTHFWPVPLLMLITKIPGSTSEVNGTRPWGLINLPDPAPIRRGHETARNKSCYDFYEPSKFLSPRLLLCKSIKTAQSFNVFFNRNEKKTKEACHYGGTGGWWICRSESGKQNFECRHVVLLYVGLYFRSKIACTAITRIQGARFKISLRKRGSIKQHATLTFIDTFSE